MMPAHLVQFCRLNSKPKQKTKPKRLRTLACTTSIGPGATNMLTGAAAATIVSAHQRQSRIHVFPGGFQPDVIGVFGDGQGAGSSRKEVEVIDVVTWSGDDWMEPGTDKDGVAILRSDGDVTREIGGVEALEREAFFWTVDAVVVDFVEVDFDGRIVD